MEDQDVELIKKTLRGDQQSLEFLIKRYLQPVYNFIYQYVKNSADAEDVTQETFVKVWRHLKKFDQKRPFKPWLYQIAKNTCLDWLKKKRAIPFSEWEKFNGQNLAIEDFIDEAAGPDLLAGQSLLRDKLTEATEKLPPQYAAVVSLRHKQELNFREIARVLREPMNTVKSRYQRALVLLKKIIKY